MDLNPAQGDPEEGEGGRYENLGISDLRHRLMDARRGGEGFTIPSFFSSCFPFLVSLLLFRSATSAAQIVRAILAHKSRRILPDDENEGGNVRDKTTTASEKKGGGFLRRRRAVA